MMLLNPFVGFRSGEKVAEVTRVVSRSRHFDAPMVPLHDWPWEYRTQLSHEADNAQHLAQILASELTEGRLPPGPWKKENPLMDVCFPE